MATHLFSGLENPMVGGSQQSTVHGVHGVSKSQTRLSDNTHLKEVFPGLLILRPSLASFIALISCSDLCIHFSLFSPSCPLLLQRLHEGRGHTCLFLVVS